LSIQRYDEPISATITFAIAGTDPLRHIRSLADLVVVCFLSATFFLFFARYSEIELEAREACFCPNRQSKGVFSYPRSVDRFTATSELSIAGLAIRFGGADPMATFSITVKN
jgi:hypothetical protein